MADVDSVMFAFTLTLTDPLIAAPSMRLLTDTRPQELSQRINPHQIIENSCEVDDREPHVIAVD